MKIAVVETDGKGGMLHFSHMLAEALSRAGNEVTLFTATDYELDDVPRSFAVRPDFSLWSRVEPRPPGEAGILRDLYVRFLRRSARAIRLFVEQWRSASHVKALAPDLVLVRPYPLPGHGLILRRLKGSGAALVEITHEFEPRDTPDRTIARIESILSGASSLHVDARLFMGERVRARYSELYPSYPRERMFLIPHGDGELFRILADETLNIDQIFDLGPEDRMVLFFGNLRSSKGVETLVRAFAAAEKPDGSRLLIVGHPAREFDSGIVRRLIDTLGLGDSVTLDPSYVPMPMVGPLFERARLLVLPYSSATQSGPLHVAMTFGVPVVAMNTGGIADVIEDGVTGFLIEPGNESELSDVIGRLLGDDQLVTEVRGAIQETAGRYGWGEVAKAVLAASGQPG